MTETDASTLSETQEKVLSLLPIFSGLLSAWGSLQIIHAVWLRFRRGRRDESESATCCYQRIMLGLSCSDLISSLALSLQAFLLPRETSQRAWVIGNQYTCGLMGFFQQSSLATIFYNGMLSFLFLLTIRYSIDEKRLVTLYEPWMHGLSIGFPLVTASTLAALGMYGELQVGPWCWVTGEDSAIFGMFMSGVPILFFLIAVPVNNTLVYDHIRTSMTRGSDHHDSEGEVEIGTVTAASSHCGYSTGNVSSPESVFRNEEIQEEKREMARQRDLQERQARRLRKIAVQGFLYVGAFLVTSIPTVVLRICAGFFALASADESNYFPLLVVQAILLPLQGLLNFLIYSRTAYLRETG